MGALTSWRGLLFALCAGVILVALLGHRPVEAGGPIAVGGTFGVSGQAFTWSVAAPIGYRTDPGPLSATVNNATALTRVAGMFNVWQNVTTASISYINAGSILAAPGYVAGNDVDTVAEFNAVEGSCNTGAQSPIVFDADGSIFDALVGDPNVIGFAGPCALSSTGRIVSGEAALNGRFQDGIDTPGSTPPNFELSTLAFNAAFIHEFGHFSGLDHSQLNVNCLSACSAAELSGLPTMFPILVSTEMATLAPDDIAWISRLYPETVNNPPTQIPFASTFGTITGTIFFSDGVTHAQGVNVIARQVGNPGANAVSVVSGFRFTGNPGQSVTAGTPSDNVGGSIFGSRDVNLIGFYEIPGLAPGNYTIEVESIDPGFTVGSSVGPLDPPFPNPGANEFFSSPENDTDGGAPATSVLVAVGPPAANINIVLNGTPPRFDSFEARLWLPEPVPLWIRMLVPFLNSVAG